MSNINVVFEHPLLLLLAIPAFAIILIPFLRLPKRRRGNFRKIAPVVIHLIVVTLLILVIAGFTLVRDTDEKAVMLLVDLSDSTQSVQDAVAAKAQELLDLMEEKTPAAHFTALEIQEESADMARRSIQMNGQENKISVVTGDVKEASKLFASASFDVVTVNPPYMTGGHGLTNPEQPKAIARHEILCTLEDVIRESAACLKPGGHLFMVHRPFRLSEIMVTMNRYRLEPKRMRLVYPYVDREPNMVLIEATRGGNPRITVEAPLIVWDAPNVYSKEMRENYGY